MRQTPPAEDLLFEEAMTLVIRLQNDPGNPITMEMVQQWRGRSADHEKAWAEAAEIHGMAGKVLKDRRAVERRAKLGLTRRNLVIGAGIGLGAITAGQLVIPPLLLAARADHITRTAEIRPVRLPDGSVATMGPESAIALAYSDHARRVSLLAGMSYFDVIRDARRPFEVTSDGVIATASQAAFDISNDAGYVTVAVNQGQMDVRAPNTDLAIGGALGAGHWLSIQDRRRSIDRGSRDPAQIGAWRDGMIVAEREAVSSVLARIARWQRARLVTLDPTIGSRRVSGVYDLTQPIAALEAVVHPFGGAVRQITPFLIVISPI
jgi:transmembrane sensor